MLLLLLFLVISQETSHQKTPSTFRRSLNAFRSKIITKKGSRKKEPGYDDKNALTTQNNQSSSGNPSDGISSRLSFDPSLPSYYRVSRIYTLYTITFHVNTKLQQLYDLFFFHPSFLCFIFLPS